MNYDNMMVTLKAQATPELAEDIQDLIKKLEKERDGYLHQLLDTRHKLHQQDYTVENQKKALETTRTTLEKYEQENAAMKTLVGLWANG